MLALYVVAQIVLSRCFIRAHVTLKVLDFLMHCVDVTHQVSLPVVLGPSHDLSLKRFVLIYNFGGTEKSVIPTTKSGNFLMKDKDCIQFFMTDMDPSLLSCLMHGRTVDTEIASSCHGRPRCVASWTFDLI